jgi:hypothetical protein
MLLLPNRSEGKNERTKEAKERKKRKKGENKKKGSVCAHVCG